MTTVVRRGSINAPVDSVWAVLCDFGAISSWASNVDHSCLMSDQVEGVGTIRRIQADRTALVETVETWEPAVELSYRISGLPPVIRSLTNTWRLEAIADSTHVVLTTVIDAGPRPPQRLIARVVGRRLAAASEQMIFGLTASVEQLERTKQEERP